jgi:hypothetical protein
MLKQSMLAAAAATALAGCAADGAGMRGDQQTSLSSGRCFRGNDVNNFNVRNEQTVYISTRQNYVFRLDTSGDCFDRGTPSVAISPFTGGDPLVCVGEEARVSVGQFRAPSQPCLARVSGPIADSRESGLSSRLSTGG